MPQQQFAEFIKNELAEFYGEDSKNKYESELRDIIKNISKEVQHIKNTNIMSLKTQENQDKAQRLLKYLNKTWESNYEKLSNIKNQEEIINSIVKLYFLTEEYFSIRQIITRPQFIMTAVDKTEGLYIRHDFEMQIKDNASQFLRTQRPSGSEGIGLRFNTSSVLQQMKEIIKNDEKQINQAKLLYKHYKSFITPYEKFYKNKDTKMNEGVAREAFERHLEKYHSGFLKDNKDFKPCRIESVGRRWLLWRASSGSDPYFTGPDTALSQVKSENAGLVDNINTILNTAEFIIQYGYTIDREALKQALKTNNDNEIITFTKKLWDQFIEVGIDKKVEKELKAFTKKQYSSNIVFKKNK